MVSFTVQPIIALGSSLSPLIPVVSSASFSVQDPPLNTLVGHINVANVPLSAMNISFGDSNHYFAVSPVTQDLRTSPTVQAVSAFYNIGVTATNAAGTSPAAAVRVAVGTAPGAFTQQSGNFQLDFDAVPAQASEDAVMGVSTSAPTGYGDMAVKVRFGPGGSGNVDAKNSTAFASSVNVPYSPGLNYHFRLMIRIPTHTFDAYVTPPGQSEVLFASNFAFETLQSSVTVLGYLGTISAIGGVTVTNMILTGAPPAAPVVTNANFTLTIPATNGQTVGTMVATGSPTSWQITGGNSSGFYAINNTGTITVTTAGASGITAGNYSLTCTATNAVGSGSGTASITATTVSIPLTFNDPRFAGNVLTSGDFNVPVGGTCANRTFTDSGTTSSIIGSAYTVDTCNIDSKEGVRCGGGTGSGTCTVKNCYIRVTGDINFGHADGFQVFISPPASVNTMLQNSAILVIPNGSATAGFFDADSNPGTFRFDNCCFLGGPVGLRINADAGPGKNYDVYLNNVFFVQGAFQFSNFQIEIPAGFTGANLTIRQWTNVRLCTIVNNQIVPGALLNSPYPVGVTQTPGPTNGTG